MTHRTRAMLIALWLVAVACQSGGSRRYSMVRRRSQSGG